MNILLQLAPLLWKFLEGFGVVKSPENEIKLRQMIEESEARKDEAYAAFIAATTPKLELPAASRVAVWANTVIAILIGLANVFIALVRPGLAVFSLLSIVFWTDRWVAVLKVLADAGVWGAIALIPLWEFVIGRDGLRVVLGAIVSWRTGKAPAEALPPGVPTLSETEAIPRALPQLEAPTPPEPVMAPAEPIFRLPSFNKPPERTEFAEPVDRVDRAFDR